MVGNELRRWAPSKARGENRQVTDRQAPLSEVDSKIAELIRREVARQEHGLELIASENFVSIAVLEAMGTALTNKYAEGLPGKRYYGGCEVVDQVEQLAIDRAKQLFGAEHANVQPHSGAQANMAAYLAVAKFGDTLLGLALPHGGHLTHGSPVNFSGTLFRATAYTVREDTGRIDYDLVRDVAKKEKPRIIIGGGSAYARIVDFPLLRSIADEVGAVLVVDMAHFAGLVAGGVYPSPVPHAQLVTSTTHKTLRGPRGGLILCTAEHAKAVAKQVFPGTQGGPLEHVIAAKAVALLEASQPDFKQYGKGGVTGGGGGRGVSVVCEGGGGGGITSGSDRKKEAAYHPTGSPSTVHDHGTSWLGGFIHRAFCMARSGWFERT